MMNRSAHWRPRLLVLCACLCLLAGCAPTPTKSDRGHADWSRGLLVGQAGISDSIGATFQGDMLYAAWATDDPEADAMGLRFAAIDSAATVLLSQDLDLPTDLPSQVRLNAGQQGHLHLTWLGTAQNTRLLFYARLSPDGALDTEARPLSLATERAAGYAALPTDDGGLRLFWYSDDGVATGIYHLQLDAWGQTVGENRLLRPGGTMVSVASTAGGYHMAWYEEPEFIQIRLHYATYESESGILSEAAQLTEFPSPTGVLARRPAVAEADSLVYIFWSVERRGGGLTPPSAATYYLTFPVGRPDLATDPAPVNIPSEGRPIYDSADSVYHLQELAVPSASVFPARFVYLPSLAVFRDELAVAFSVETASRTKETVQPVVTLWSDGRLRGYQIASKTTNSSLKPSLLNKGDGDLYLLWIDTAGFGSYDVYYASTADAAQSKLNRITSHDIAAAVFDLLWAVVQALSSSPLASPGALCPSPSSPSTCL